MEEFKNIPLDEDHRFLNWQDTIAPCRCWTTWFREKKTPHKLIEVSDERKNSKACSTKWSIFKHMIIAKKSNTRYCCEEGKKQFNKATKA